MIANGLAAFLLAVNPANHNRIIWRGSLCSLLVLQPASRIEPRKLLVLRGIGKKALFFQNSSGHLLIKQCAFAAYFQKIIIVKC